MTRTVFGSRHLAHLSRPELLLILLFVVSRLWLHRLGVRIDRLPSDAWQLVDPPLLQDALLESLLYLHSQPPLYNLLVAALMRLGDAATAVRAMDLLYTTLGLVLALSVFHLLRQLAVGRWTSFAAAALFTLSPAAVLYESFPLYTQPAAALLCLCAVLFVRMIRAFTPWKALALFLAMAALIYLRSLFQLGWLVVLLGFCSWVLPRHRRDLLLAAAFPMALVAALYGKHYYLTGQFSTSSWLGMSLAKLTTMQLPLAERQALVRAGVLSPRALQAPFAGPEGYPDALAATAPTGIAVLDQTRKRSGAANLHHAVYPAVSRQYLDDALAVIRHRPTAYLSGVTTALLLYCRPAADYPFLEPQRSRIEPMNRLYNRVVAGQPTYPIEAGLATFRAGEIGYLIVAGLVVSVLFALPAVRRCLRGHGSDADAILTFLWLNVLYVTAVGNALEIDENQRFRYLVNPLLTVTFTAIVARAYNCAFSRSSTAS